MSDWAGSEEIISVALDLFPSGAGERSAVDMSVSGTTITVQLSGGMGRRTYQNRFTATGVTGRVWQWVVLQHVLDPAFSPYAPPPSETFGTPLTWSSGVSMFGTGIVSVATGLVAAGTTQATALPMAAATNIFASAPEGTGAILPDTVTSGTIIVQNNDATNALQIYPPSGASINALTSNAPFVIAANGGRISFSTSAPASQWYAG
ncbi:MAG: hypothetical protein P4L71_00395 [Acetobacteraceae bacterium]|nr:hypothetical protein [Acetobacteraceae bacterium]